MIDFDFTGASYTHNQRFDFSVGNLTTGTADGVLALNGQATVQLETYCAASADLPLTGTATGVLGTVIVFDCTDAVYSDNQLFNFGTNTLTAIAVGVLALSGSAASEFKTHLIATAHADLTLNGTASCASIVNLCTAHADLVLSGGSVAEYDFAVKRYLTACVFSNTQDGSRLITSRLSNQQAAIKCEIAALSMTGNAVQTMQSLHAVQNQPLTLSSDAQLVRQDGFAVCEPVSSLTNVVNTLTASLLDAKQQGAALDTSLTSVQDVVFFKLHTLNLVGHQASLAVYRVLRDSTITQVMDDNQAFTFDNSYTDNTLFEFSHDELSVLCERVAQGLLTASINAPSERPKRYLRNACFIPKNASYPLHGKTKKIAGIRPPPILPTTDHQILTIPTRATYTMQHSILVKLLPDNTEIQLSKISLSYDVDGYAWIFSATLANKADVSLFNMADFDAVQLSITVDGYTWLVLVEEIPEKKSFGKTDIQLTGRSIAALLGEPWMPVDSFTAGSDMTVQQIADALIPFDWTIDWQYPTWLVPANCFSYTQQSPIQALKGIANSIGAVLVPVRDSKTLRIQPRYPVLPWHYDLTGITPDLIIPDSAIESIGIKSRTTSPINGVYVHGTTATGILARCVLSGTAGEVLAPTESNPLITNVIGARALAERILASKVTPPSVSSVTTFLGGDFPLVNIGALVAVNNEKATVTGNAINVEFGKVRQTLTFGENSTNLYARLIGMLPKSPLLVGTIVSLYEDNAIVSLIGSGVVTVRGTGIVGQNYYIRNGLIESAAPNLNAVEIVI